MSKMFGKSRNRHWESFQLGRSCRVSVLKHARLVKGIKHCRNSLFITRPVDFAWKPMFLVFNSVMKLQ